MSAMNKGLGPEIDAVFGKLELLLEHNNIDEGWSDWLHTFANRMVRSTASGERTRLLRQLQQGEHTLYQLRAFLPESTPDGEYPRREFDHLIYTLDTALCQELEDLKAVPQRGQEP